MGHQEFAKCNAAAQCGCQSRHSELAARARATPALRGHSLGGARCDGRAAYARADVNPIMALCRARATLVRAYSGSAPDSRVAVTNRGVLNILSTYRNRRIRFGKNSRHSRPQQAEPLRRRNGCQRHQRWACDLFVGAALIRRKALPEAILYFGYHGPRPTNAVRSRHSIACQRASEQGRGEQMGTATDLVPGEPPQAPYTPTM